MTRVALLASVMVFVWVASAAHGLDSDSTVAAAGSSIYTRATNRFEDVQLFKPKEQSDQNMAFTLAPLLLQESPGSTARSNLGALFGALEPADGGARVQTTRPTVYFEPNTAVLNGKPHATMTYVWFYAAARAEARPRPLSAQGIRITLDSTGKPAIWEVMSDPTTADILFVSQSVEVAAMAQYGQALPGRRYAVEQSRADSPTVVVARVIDDGPVPMGPIVYLRSPSHAVSTVICRCMPAQASRVTQSVYYNLAEEGSVEHLVQNLKGFPGGFLTNGAAVLSKRLRLPSSF